jgi:hypothetical protein
LRFEDDLGRRIRYTSITESDMVDKMLEGFIARYNVTVPIHRIEKN